SGDHGATQYDIQIEADRLSVRLKPIDVALLVYAEDAGADQLAPGILLHCGSGDRKCTQAERQRWSGFAAALSLGRARARDQIWAAVATPPPVVVERPASPLELWLRAGVTLFGLGWLAVYGGRRASEWASAGVPKATPALLLSGALILVFVGVALWGTAALPLHEHNSYVARNDCAWTPGCVKDPAGPGWVEAFRSEEHTSELQSRENLVCRLLLEK